MKIIRSITPILITFLFTACSSAPEYRKADYPSLTHKDNELFNALRLPKDGTAEKCLASGANPNARDANGLSPLHLAVMNGDVEMVEKLLNAGAKPNVRTRTGYSPLHAAAATSECAAIELLIKSGAEVDLTNNRAWTPLMEAARMGNIKAVELLLENNASLSARDDQGRTPLMFAATSKKNSLETMEYLLSMGAKLHDIDNSGNTATMWAMMNKNHTTASKMADHFESYKKDEELAILGLLTMKVAIYANDQEVVKKLIEKGLPVDRDIAFAYKATKVFNVHGIHKILARNNAIEDGKTPLIWAAEKNNVDIIRILLNAGANPFSIDNAGNTAVQYASDYAAVRTLKKAMNEYKKK